MKTATREKQIQKQISFAREVEAATDEILEKLPPKEDSESPSPVVCIQRDIRRAHNLAWAMQVFPLFDPACLTRLVIQQFKDFRPQFGGSGKAYTGGLWVPAFAAIRIFNYEDRARRRPTEDVARLCGRMVGTYDAKALNQNREALEPTGSATYEIEARAPKIPASVHDRVKPIEPRFEQVDLVFEAEWAPSPVKDPLVIGRISECFFLVDQFDLTKLERYISSEFCRKAD